MGRLESVLLPGAASMVLIRRRDRACLRQRGMVCRVLALSQAESEAAMSELKQPPNCPQISMQESGWRFATVTLVTYSTLIVGSVAMRAWLREAQRIVDASSAEDGRHPLDSDGEILFPGYLETTEQAELWSKYAGGE